MTTPPPDGSSTSDSDARWADPSSPVSFAKPAGQPAEPAAEAPFDPYRFGPPEHPVPPEYAPPGYVPPPPATPAPPLPPLPPAGAPPAGGPGYPPGYPPGYYPPQPYPYGAPPPYAQRRATNGKAIAALVLGVLSIPFCLFSVLDLILIIPAIVFGSLALNEAKGQGSNGRGLALAGFICAVVGAVLAITITVWLYPKVARCVNDYPQGSAEYNTCIRNVL